MNLGYWHVPEREQGAADHRMIIEGVRMAFGGHLSAQNRWVKLAELMPWEHIEEIYALSLSQETGRYVSPSRKNGHENAGKNGMNR